MDKKFADLYEELGIFSHREFEARNEIKFENTLQLLILKQEYWLILQETTLFQLHLTIRTD